jgi:hypothetical protein
LEAEKGILRQGEGEPLGQTLKFNPHLSIGGTLGPRKVTNPINLPENR